MLVSSSKIDLINLNRLALMTEVLKLHYRTFQLSMKK